MAKKRKDGGINSFIEKAESNFGEKIIYKKYKDNDKERMEREIEFLLEQEKNNLRNVPLLREKTGGGMDRDDISRGRQSQRNERESGVCDNRFS